MRNRLVHAAFVIVGWWVLAIATQSTQAAEHAAVINRVGSDIQYLASDALEGRGPGTDGLDKAEQFIRTAFENLGMRGAGNDGAYLRPFSIAIGAEVVKPKTFLVLHDPEGQEWKLALDKEFQPLSTDNADPLTLDVIFAGYGISAPKLDYDDYQGVDVKGKAVIVIRREPQQANEKSVFDGAQTSKYSYIRTKTRAAEKAGAAAILLVNDPFTTEKEKADQLSRPGGFGRGVSKIPFFQIKQDVIDKILQQSPLNGGENQWKSLDAIAEAIDEHLKPISQPLDSWTVELRCAFESTKDDVSNVAAVIEGEGPLAEETIIIGAHYDHLGFGPYGSRRPKQRAVHNGADDNATGTAAVIELARRFAGRAKKPARRLVFIAFTGEERGLLGSYHYLKNPLLPLDQTVAMLNFDMIGHLDTGGLSIGGVGSAKEFTAIIEQLNERGPISAKPTTAAGGSDHAGFYRNDVPFLFFHTGLTATYHTPEDDYETIDVGGAVATIDYGEQVIDALLAMAKRPVFTKMARKPRVTRASAYLGIVPDYGAQAKDGVRCMQVNPGSPAAKGTLQVGDVIVKIGDAKVLALPDLIGALGKYKAGTRVTVVVRRGNDEKSLDVTLGTLGK